MIKKSTPWIIHFSSVSPLLPWTRFQGIVRGSQSRWKMVSLSVSVSVVVVAAELVRHRIDYWHRSGHTVQYSIDWRADTAR